MKEYAIFIKYGNGDKEFFSQADTLAEAQAIVADAKAEDRRFHMTGNWGYIIRKRNLRD